MCTRALTLSSDSSQWGGGGGGNVKFGMALNGSDA